MYNDLMLLCENYLSGFDEEKRFFTVEDRSRRFKAILAQSELAFRLRKADNLGQGRLAAVRNDYIAFWTLYDTYRDLPESVDLLRLLERAKQHPSIYKYSDLDTLLLVDVWRRVDAEINRR